VRNLRFSPKSSGINVSSHYSQRQQKILEDEYAQYIYKRTSKKYIEIFRPIPINFSNHSHYLRNTILST
jgi:predicted Co/Zn/Cd cation transporter (cation efflux family)